MIISARAAFLAQRALLPSPLEGEGWVGGRYCRWVDTLIV